MKPLCRCSHIPARVLIAFLMLAASMETARAQVVTLSRTSISFGSVGVGSTSAGTTVRLTNTSTTTALSIAGIVASGSFAETDNCGTSVAPSGRCNITVTFTPAALGAATGNIVITDNASPGTQTITLTGTGVTPITVTPGSRNFGTVAQGDTSTARTFRVQNHTAAAAPITVSSTNAAFAVTGCGASVAANASCTLSVTFAPAATTPPGPQTGSVVVAYTGFGSPQSVSLTGTVVTPLTAQPATLTFNSALAVGTPSQPRSVTITNRSTAAIAIGSIVAAPSAYAITANTCPSSLAAPGSCTVTIVFTPTVAGTIAGTLTTTYGSGNSQLVVAMTGGGAVNSLRSLVITAPSASLTVGASEQLTATGTYRNGTTGNVTSAATWTSSNTSVATVVSNTGVATAVAPGTATITAAVTGTNTNNGTVQNTFALTVPKVLVSIAVSPAGVTLGLNGTQQFTATGTYSDGTTANLTGTSIWASFNPSVVTVNASGLATVVATPTPNVAVAVTASSGTIAPYGATNTAFVSTSTTLPATCTTPTIDMRLLVINNAGANAGAGYADFPAIQQILSYVGTPYDVADVSGTLPTLSNGACHGYYQGIIYAFGDDIYTNPAFNQALTSYEQTFKVRQLNWFTNPTPDFGFNYYANSIPSTGTDSGSFTVAASPIFFYANMATPIAISNAFVYLTTPATPSGGGTVTPLLVDSGGYTLSGITNFSDGRQYLSQMFDSNPYLTHDLVLAYGLLNWVTKGVFLGDYHVYATPQVDDVFINDSEWIPSTTCLTNLVTKDRTAPDASNLPVFRVNSADMTQLASWQSGIQNDPSGLFQQFKLTMAFNGVGTVGNGDWTGLTAPIISSSATNGVASLTAQGFSGLPGQTVTVTNTTNGGGVLNGTWTIVSVTSSAATTPGTTTFTANIPAAGNLTLQAENGAPDNSATATASVPDDLVMNLQSYQGAFHWISHTYDHPSTLNGLCQNSPNNPGLGCGDAANAPNYTDDIDLEILTNRWVASDPNAQPAWMLDLDPTDRVQQLTFTDFNPANIVTPGITGLNDPNVPGYLYNDGIRFAVTDTSVIGQANNGPNPSPNVGIVNSFAAGLYEVPRHPNDVFYNAANWGDDQAEFVCIYQNYVPPNSPPGTVPAPDPPFNTYNAAQILDFTSSAFLNNMLIGDMDPEMFHQPDLHFADNYPALTATPFGAPNPPVNIPGLASPHISSLISDTYNVTFSKYKALYNLPVLTPTLDQIGTLMQNRNSFNLSGITASIVVGTSGSQITISMPSTATIPSAVIPVTGLASTGAETYGGQNISHINMTPGTVVTLPLP